MEAKLLQNDEAIIENVLIPGESLLWAERTKMPRSSKIATALAFVIGAIVTVAFIFVPWGATGEFRNGYFLGFLPGGLFMLSGVYCFWYYSGEHYNVVTDIRVMTCHIKRGYSLRVNQLPFRFMDIIDTISTHTLEFKTRQHAATVRFEHVSDYYDVEKICRGQLVMHTRGTDMIKLNEQHMEDMQPNVHYENPLDVLKSEEKKKQIEIPNTWPPIFIKLLEEILNRQEEPEKLLWAYSPPRWELLSYPIIAHIMEEILVIIFSVWLESVIFWLILTAVVIISFAVSTLYSCYYGQAYALTNKSFIEIRRGFRPTVDKQDYVRYKANITHGIRFTLGRLFPMFSTFKIATGKGYVYLPVPKSKSVLSLSNVKEFHSYLFDQFADLDKPSIHINVVE